MLLVAKRTTQKHKKEPPVMGRKNSMDSVKGVIMVASIRVNKDRITLAPISMWLRHVGNDIPIPDPVDAPIEPVQGKSDED